MTSGKVSIARCPGLQLFAQSKESGYMPYGLR